MLFEKIIQLLSDQRTDGVNRIVPRQALFDKPTERTGNGFIVCRQLVLHNNVHGSVETPCAPRQRNSCVSVKRFNELDPFAFIRLRPFLGRGCLFRIVIFHCPVASCDS